MILVLYFVITHYFRNRFTGSEPLQSRNAILFTTGIILLYILKGSPIDLLGHILFYVHMSQMALLYLVVTPMLILGIPVWLWKRVLQFPLFEKPFKFFTKPIIALLGFNGLFSLYHIPVVFDQVKTDPLLHAVFTTVLFLLSIFMWWPFFNQLPAHQSLNGMHKVGYIFANGALLTPACALIIFAGEPMYATYSNPTMWTEAMKLCVPAGSLEALKLSGPELFQSMSLKFDQQLGGVLMKILQEVIYGVFLARAFFQWFREEQEPTEIQVKSFQ